MGLTTPPLEAARCTTGWTTTGRPATPLVEVRPQMGYERHCGSCFELVLDVTVPQMGRELVELPNVVSQVVEQNVDIPVRPDRGRSKIPSWSTPRTRFTGVFSVVEYSAPAPEVSEAPAPVTEYFFPAPAVFQAPALMVYCTLASSFSFAHAIGGVHLSCASGVRIAFASFGVHLICASGDPVASACGGAQLARACSVSFANAHLTHAGSVSCLSVSSGVWSSSVAPWCSGPCPTSGGRALRAG